MNIRKHLLLVLVQRLASTQLGIQLFLLELNKL
jgi:hypothetical protein